MAVVKDANGFEGFPKVPEEYVSGRSESCRYFLLEKERDAVVRSGLLGDRWVPSTTDKEPRGRTRLSRIELDRGSALIRPFHHGGLFRFLTGDRFLNPYPPFHELDIAEKLRRAEILTPQPVAAIAKKKGLFYRLYFVSQEVLGKDLFAYLQDDAVGDSERKKILKAAGALIKKLHDFGLVHRDLHPRNLFLEEGSGDLWVLDLEGARVLRPMPEAKQLSSLARFYRYGKKWEYLHGKSFWREEDLLSLMEGYEAGNSKSLEAAVRKTFSRNLWIHRVGWFLERRAGEGSFCLCF